MERCVLNMLSEGNKEDFFQIDLVEFNPNDLRTIPFDFRGDLDLEDEFEISEGFKEFPGDF